MAQRIQGLTALLPDLASPFGDDEDCHLQDPRPAGGKQAVPAIEMDAIPLSVHDWVQLSADLGSVAQHLMCLRQALPGANVSLLVARHPRLLLRPVHQLDAACKQACTALAATANPGAILEAAPFLLDDPRLCTFMVCELTRMFGASAAAQYLQSNPAYYALSCQPLMHQMTRDQGSDYGDYLGEVYDHATHGALARQLQPPQQQLTMAAGKLQGPVNVGPDFSVW